MERMRVILALLFIALLLPQSTYGEQIDLETQVAQQVQRIKTMSGQSENSFLELQGISRADGALVQLIGYGMEAIPFLTPYLDDTSLTQAYRVDGSRRRKQVAVNEYIVFVINKIANHEFYLSDNPEGALPDYASLEDQVLSWWEENREKTLLERKINDVNNPDHPNRFAAYQWLGQAKSKEARAALEQRIDVLLTGEVNSLKQAEMAASADALGKIGDQESAAVIVKVCDHLSYWLGMTYRPLEQGRSGAWFGQISELFKAHRALAVIGLKAEALSRLRSFRRSI